MDLYELLFKSAANTSESLNASIPWYKKAQIVCKSYSAITRDQGRLHHNVYNSFKGC